MIQNVKVCILCSIRDKANSFEFPAYPFDNFLVCWLSKNQQSLMFAHPSIIHHTVFSQIWILIFYNKYSFVSKTSECYLNTVHYPSFCCKDKEWVTKLTIILDQERRCHHVWRLWRCQKSRQAWKYLHWQQCFPASLQSYLCHLGLGLIVGHIEAIHRWSNWLCRRRNSTKRKILSSHLDLKDLKMEKKLKFYADMTKKMWKKFMKRRQRQKTSSRR